MLLDLADPLARYLLLGLIGCSAMALMLVVALLSSMFPPRRRP